MPAVLYSIDHCHIFFNKAANTKVKGQDYTVTRPYDSQQVRHKLSGTYWITIRQP